MDLPDPINMKAEQFADGKNGYALQQSGNSEFGIHRKSTRENHGAPWKEEWFADALLGEVFDSQKALYEAMKDVSEEHHKATLGTHESELDKMINQAFKDSDEAKIKRAELMPDEKSALNQMFEAFLRLKELGFSEAMYCPKDGSIFDAIEPGSTGIHDCSYVGVWPNGHWMIHADNDLWPSHPILYRVKIKTEDNSDIFHDAEGRN